jgi:hypothetical protein
MMTMLQAINGDFLKGVGEPFGHSPAFTSGRPPHRTAAGD